MYILFLNTCWVALKRAVLIKQSSCDLSGLLGEEDGLDVGKDATLGDGDSAQEFVQLLVVLDSELEVAGDDSALLVVAGGVSGELEYLSGQVLEAGSKVHGGSGSHALGVVALAEHAVNAAHGELESGFDRARLLSGFSFGGFSFS